MALQHETQVLVNVVIAFTGIAVLSVSLRFCVRWKKQRAPLGSDYWMLTALVFYLVQVAFLFHACYNGKGTIEILELTNDPGPLATVILDLDVAAFFFGAVVTSVKISIILFLRKIFISRHFKIASLITLILCVAWFFTTFSLILFRCRPISGSWDINISFLPGVCINYGDIILGYELSNIVLDAVLFILPIYDVWKLQTPFSRKLALGFVFGVGIFVIFTSIMRIVVTYGTEVLPFAKIMIWSIVQAGSAILCGCIPCLPPLLPESFETNMSAMFSSLKSWLEARLVSSKSWWTRTFNRRNTSGASSNDLKHRPEQEALQQDRILAMSKFELILDARGDSKLREGNI